MERRDSPRSTGEQQETAGGSAVEKISRIYWIGLVIGIILLMAALPTLSPALAQETQQSEEEPNNEQSEATEITVGDQLVEVDGVLSFGDEDWYAFDATEGSFITIDYSGSAGEARLRGPDNTVLDSESPTIHRLQATADETGTYYLQLTTIAAANGDYTFTIDIENDTEDTEKNDSTPTPTDTTNNTTTPTPVSDTATGDWSDHCSEDGIQPVSPGSYSDLISPTDRDVLLTDLSEGDFITVNLTYDGANNTELAIYGDADNISFSGITGDPSSSIPNFADEGTTYSDMNDDGDNEKVRRLTVTPGITQFRVYAESSGICLAFHTMPSDHNPSEPEDSAEGGAGTWSLSFTVNEADARSIESIEPPTSSELAELESQVEELEQRIEELEQRVDELENETDAGNAD